MSEEKKWEVGHDGLSLGMLVAPDGRVFRIQELGKGRGDMWGNAEDNDELCGKLAAAMNSGLTPKKEALEEVNDYVQTFALAAGAEIDPRIVSFMETLACRVASAPLLSVVDAPEGTHFIVRKPTSDEEAAFMIDCLCDLVVKLCERLNNETPYTCGHLSHTFSGITMAMGQAFRQHHPEEWAEVVEIAKGGAKRGHDDAPAPVPQKKDLH